MKQKRLTRIAARRYPLTLFLIAIMLATLAFVVPAARQARLG
jgi:hypothetical protein